MRLHHVQLPMPRGQEAEARRFYGEALGLSEVPSRLPLPAGEVAGSALSKQMPLWRKSIWA